MNLKALSGIGIAIQVAVMLFTADIPVHAQNNLQGQESFLESLGSRAGFDTLSSNADTDLAQKIGAILNGFLGLLGVIFLVFIIYGGILWMTAAGKDDQVGKARKVLQMATIGLVIVISAYTLSSFIFSVLGNAVGGAGIETQP